jgi:iron complex transport system substrate-binding protein
MFNTTNKKIVLGVILLVVIIGGSYGAYTLLSTPESTEPTETEPTETEPTETEPTETEPTETEPTETEPTETEPTETEPTETEPTETEPTETEPTETEPETVTVVDGLGNEVTVTLPVERVITLDPGLTEIVCVLGREDKLVGRDSTASMVVLPLSVEDVPAVEYNAEIMLELEPDLIISGAALDYYTEVKEQLEEAGIPIFITGSANSQPSAVTDTTPVDISCELTTTIAKLLGAEDTAADYVTYVQYYNNIIKERTANLTREEKPIVFLEWYQPYQTSVINYQNSVGAINIAENETTFYTVLSAEFVVSQNPDVIIYALSSPDHDEADFIAARDAILTRSELSEVNAVINGQVYVYDYIVLREGVGSHEIVGLLYWAKWCHPGLFADIDPAAVNSEMNQLFFGRDETGVYAYPETVTIVDATETEITITLPVERIVGLNGGLTEVVCALGCEDKIVGRPDSYELYYPSSLVEKPNAGDSLTPNLEIILELEPDLIVTDTAIYNNEGILEVLAEAGIPVIIEDSGVPSRISTIITNLGRVLGKTERAAEIVETIEGYTNLVEERLQDVTDSEKPTFFLGFEDYGWLTMTNGSVANDRLVAAGGINIAANATVMYPTLSPEYVVEANPDIIIVMAWSGNDLEAHQYAQNQFLENPALNEVTAVQEERVYTYNDCIGTGVQYPVGLLYFAKWFHPDLFEDIDVDAIHAELIQDFFGEEVSGVNVYP